MQVRLALANLRVAASREESVELAEAAIDEAGRLGALVVCFPECYVPGYRVPGIHMAPPDAEFLRSAHARIRAAAAQAATGVVLGTERVDGGNCFATALVILPDGSVAGCQDKVQLDPSEDGVYCPGSERHLFQIGPLRFGVAICHEAWRYPETVRWAARRGAHVVFHPHFHLAEPGGYRPATFADPANTFHEKAVLCRAAENSIFFATVNYAEEGSPTTSAIAGPDGVLLAFQPYGEEGLLVVDIELAEATGLLASRCRY